MTNQQEELIERIDRLSEADKKEKIANGPIYLYNIIYSCK